MGEVNPGLEGKADMAEMAWMTNDPDTLPFLALRTDAWPDKGGFNSGYYSNPEVDALLEKARVATDQDERAALYKELQLIVQEDAPWVFVANWKQNAVTTERVGNFSLETLLPAATPKRDQELSPGSPGFPCPTKVRREADSFPTPVFANHWSHSGGAQPWAATS